MSLLVLALKSLQARRLAAGLTVFAVATSLALIIVVETVRDGARQGFLNTISSTDLIMGARTGGVQLLLYSVFHLGNATNNITWKSYQDIAAIKDVSWIVPISLGDSHRGFRVVGTTPTFFQHYSHGQREHLQFSSGKRFSGLFDVVIGAAVAKELAYDVGTNLIVAHGLESFVEHTDFPFQVSGVLKATGTPVDRSVLVSLEAIEAIHTNMAALRGAPKGTTAGALFESVDLTPKAVTAALIGVETKLGIFGVQRQINSYSEEPLTAILPGVTLSELYQITTVAETALRVVLWAVIVASLLGMSAMLVATLSARERELAIMRTIGASSLHIVSLIMMEALVLAALSSVCAIILANVLLIAAGPIIESRYGLALTNVGLMSSGSSILAVFLLLAPFAGLFPVFSAYRSALVTRLALKN
ncbi:MAG: ABC transporter permease [Maritimibacter sp.]